MKMGIVGLGRMGANMARRLRRGGIEVAAWNRSEARTQELAAEVGVEPMRSLADLVRHLPAPRVVWLMLPSGEPTEEALATLVTELEAGDLVVDGANANYHDTRRRGDWLQSLDIDFIDAGVSGGIWGLEGGYCVMVGGFREAVDRLRPALEALAPAPDRGWAHVGPPGSGHFVKMVHNGIEYGMMQAYAEGFALLRGREEFDLDLAQVAELWRHGSVVRSWLLDLTADALAKEGAVDALEPVVADSGEGRWTAIEAVEQGVPAPVISSALQMRFASQKRGDFGHQLLAAMRQAFGGHAVQQRNRGED